jgi:GT2 family glycosyltransferase/glycosyltransferase involved in cell wall biosynthesis
MMKLLRNKKTMSFKANEVEGYLESCDGKFISGWLYDKKKPNEPLEFILLSKGQQIYRGIADQYRADLLEANIGDGNHGFRVAIPESLLDGVDHEIELRDALNGAKIKGSPLKVFGKALLRESILIDGNLLRGSAKDVSGNVTRGHVDLIEQGDVIGVGSYWPDEGRPGKIDFFAPLPPSVFDGRPHAFEIRTQDGAISLGSAAFIMPNSLTPDEVLLKYARQAMRPSMSSLAGFRYESLSKSIQNAAENSIRVGLPLADYLKQLSYAHERLAQGFHEQDKDFAPLVFPKNDHPDVSIVIPLHNKFAVTYHCLLSLLLAPNQASYEVILVDDGSSDQTTEIPKLISGVTYLNNKESLGFIRSCNKGASVAKVEFVVMLNNDTEVTAHWLDEMLSSARHFKDVGLVGAKLLYPDGRLQEAGGIVWNTGNPWQYRPSANPLDPRFNYARQADYLSGACLLLPKSIWDQVGGFNESYVPAYFEDTDLAFAVRELGYKTVYSPLSRVIHFEGMSNGVSVDGGVKKWQEINRPKFKARWMRACRDNGQEGADIDLIKDRNIELRALVLDAETPMPDQNAGSYAAIQEIRLLQSLGFKCTFIPSNMAWMAGYTEDLQRMGVEVIYSPFAGSVNELLQKRGSEFDLVYVTRYYVAKQFLEAIRECAPRAKVVLMNADLHFLRELRAQLNLSGNGDLQKVMQTRQEELEVMTSVDLVLAYTEVEKAVILSHNLDLTKVAICPWVVEVPSNISSFGDRKDIAFLGGFNHKPNQEAVIWFADNVAPLLAKSHPKMKIRIYGSKMSADLETQLKKQANIQVEGWVESVNEVYDQCRVFIAPLQSGAGLKGKVADALAHGVPSVLSPVAAEGIAISSGIDGLIASNPQEWVNKITQVYDDEAAWQKMSQAAQQLAIRSFGMGKGIEMMQEALSEVELYVSPSPKNLVWN